MEPYQIDFAMNRGHEMVLRREPGIARDELIDVELHMLTAEQPPGLLPVEWMELDGELTFHYRLSGKRMLTHWLRLRPLAMRDYYTLLLAVVEALEACRDYMLRQEGVLLHENCIFVGDRPEQIGLVYVPARSTAEARSARTALLGLAVRWTAHVEQVDGDGLQRLLQAIDREEATLRELKVLLLELLAPPLPAAAKHGAPGAAAERAGSGRGGRREQGGEGQGRGESHGRRSVPEKSPGEPLSPELGRAAVWSNDAEGARETARRASDMQEATSIASSRRIPEETGQPLRAPALEQSSAEWMEWEEGEGAPGMDPTRLKWILGAGFIVVSAVIWRYLYLESPGMTSALLAAAGTLVAAGGCVVVWRRLLPPDADATDADLEEEGEPDPERMPRWGGWMDASADETDEEDEAFPAKRNSSTQGAAHRNRRDYGADDQEGHAQAAREAAASLEQPASSVQPRSEAARQTRPAPVAAASQGHGDIAPTARLGPDEATVLLGGEEAVGAAGIRMERSDGGRVESLSWPEGTTIIGRSSESADHVDAGSGISRAHLEVEVSAERCIVKDLGSRNGSLLNGEMMIPYKAYTLQAGDRVRLAGMSGPEYRLLA
ncbi:FHA domain-containing protein [Paenibacillus sp. IB182496]|uniref:FHA domain-containing protein n=1 Tax=Paenibacillus sabuli TaxID=2772509 RepID=A0A927GQX1_9BACL|nr:DUF6382 domain-containing protein [Paenibacillus sabuli]MBD2844320.1 FHA domain-containing protein [Paenibacillus sabuli]